MSLKKHPKAFLTAVSIAGSIIIAACGSSSPDATVSQTTPPSSSDTTSSEPTTPEAVAPKVTIDNFTFTPASLQVNVGEPVTWMNDQDAPHTVTAEDDSWTSDDVAKGEMFSHTFDTAGTFAYYCSIHPNMIGSVVVE